MVAGFERLVEVQNIVIQGNFDILVHFHNRLFQRIKKTIMYMHPKWIEPPSFAEMV